MTFISYAQNYEDVMLFRALGSVEHGFYIDVGAQDPTEDSVTKAFYERGWRGINIDPVEHWHQRLQEERPHDINLRVAISDAPGELQLFEVADSGLSTTDTALAARYRAQGLSVREQWVRCVTLDEICAEHPAADVHFLKIDCEGAEEPALRGMPLDRIRPWIVVVEASEPNTTTPNHQAWEPLVTARGYVFAYADGINRFYVSNEHRELLPAFAIPPNVLDHFERASENRAHHRVQELSANLMEARNIEHIARAEAQRDFLDSENKRREDALIALRAESDRREAVLQNEIRMQVAAHTRAQGALEQSRAALQQREAALAHLHELRTRHEVELARRQAVIGDRNTELTRLRALIENYEAEVMRLQQEHRHEVTERAELQGALQAMRCSRSWRLTAPMRGIRRGIIATRHGTLRAVLGILRRPARMLRPALRRMSGSIALRRAVVKTLGGRNSTIVRHARLFLFGAPLTTVVPGIAHDQAPGAAPAQDHCIEYSAREESVADALRRAFARDKASGE